MHKPIFAGVLGKKLALRMLLLVMLPVTFALVILFSILQQATSRDSRTANSNLLDQLSASAQINQTHLETLARAIEENSPVVAFLNTTYTPHDSYPNYDRVVAESIKGFARSIPSISVAIFMNNQTIPSGYNLFFNDDYITQIGGLSEFIHSDQRTGWFDLQNLVGKQRFRSSHPFYRSADTHLFLRKIKLYDNSTLGYIAIFAPQDYFLSSVQVPVIRFGSNVCVNYTQNAFPDELQQNLSRAISDQQETAHLIFSAKSFANLPLSLVVVTPKENQYMFSLAFAILISCCVLISFLVFSHYVHNLVADIQRCITEVQATVTNQFHYRLQRAEQPEIQPITQSINLLLDRIAALVDEAMVQQTAARQAQLAALQNQINPHFLYNTLEVMAGRMELHQLYEESDALTSFAQIFRYNINLKENNLAHVQEELLLAKRYVQVLHLSRPNVRLRILAEPNHLQRSILRFSLQPLLENCILHGLRAPDDSMDITIELLSLDSALRIKVSDNGKGMAPDMTERFNALFADPAALNMLRTTNIGLTNINTRLQLVYGTHLQIESTEQAGTTVWFDAPQSSV